MARYADNKGYVFFEEKTYPWAWAYRDYVVRAFNADKPLDRFITEQLAVDQLGDLADSRDRAALGFLTVGDHFSNNVHDILDDRIDVVTRGLLGLTVGCARCHDHKYDPVSQADYYALAGIFTSTGYQAQALHDAGNRQIGPQAEAIATPGARPGRREGRRPMPAPGSSTRSGPRWSST